jgi:hypothetical protein
MIGKRIAQALLAMLLLLVVAEGALAVGACDCPECPAQLCMHIDCIGGGGGTQCPDLTTDACPGASAATLAPTLRGDSPSFWARIAVNASALVPGDGDDSANARRTSAPRIAGPPAHIIFCRLLR